MIQRRNEGNRSREVGGEEEKEGKNQS